MLCLSVRQPFAWGLVQPGQQPGSCLKGIENRTWPTKYRGPLLIHAGSSRQALGRGRFLFPTLPPDDCLHFGKIIGLVDLVDVVPLNRVAGQPHAEGPWCWIVANPVAFPRPVRIPGRLMLFPVDLRKLGRHDLAQLVEARRPAGMLF